MSPPGRAQVLPECVWPPAEVWNGRQRSASVWVSWRDVFPPLFLGPRMPSSHPSPCWKECCLELLDVMSDLWIPRPHTHTLLSVEWWVFMRLPGVALGAGPGAAGEAQVCVCVHNRMYVCVFRVPLSARAALLGSALQVEGS